MDINTSYNNTERTSPLPNPLPEGEGVSGTAVGLIPLVSQTILEFIWSVTTDWRCRPVFGPG